MNLSLCGFLAYAALCNAMGFYRIADVPPDLVNSPVTFTDLDGTLYPSDPGRINNRQLAIQFLMDKKGYDAVMARRLLSAYRTRYHGMPVLGLVKEQGLNALEYERYIHARSNLASILRPDLRLSRMLGRLRTQRYVLTNSGLEHAISALNALGILNRYHGIVYVDYSRKTILTKPNLQVYREAMRLVKVNDPRRVYFVDDQSRYLLEPRQLGWNTLLLDSERRALMASGNTLPSIRSIYDLPAAWPNLFN